MFGFGAARDRDVRSLFDSQYTPLCRLAFVMLRDEHAAEEAVMDAFLCTVASWRRVRGMDRPDLYLRAAVVNACTSRLRRSTAERRARWRLAPQPAVPAPAEPDGELWKAVRDLPTRQRACVVLRYVEDRGEDDIAAILGCSIGTVKSQLAKARRKLKSALEPTGATER